MENFDARDVTFLILYRGDTLLRLENLLLVVDSLRFSFSTNIYVREAAAYNNGILAQMLSNKVRYEFVTDDTPTLYKTRHFNEMIANVNTPYMAIWDTDAIAYDSAIIECLENLRNGKAKLALPYNGVYLDTSDIIRRLYIKTRSIDTFRLNMQKMTRLQQHIMTGGAVMMDRNTFISLGAENEAYYGWGDDDFDRYIRFMNAGYAIYRSKEVLFHLSHPRGSNSGFNTHFREAYSKKELNKTKRGV